MVMSVELRDRESHPDNYTQVLPTSSTRGALLSTAEVCQLTRMTYRQVHYLVHQGVIRPTVPPRGSGTQMGWGPLDIKLLIALDALLHDASIGGGGNAVGRRGALAYVPLVRAELERDPQTTSVTIGRGRVQLVINLVPRKRAG